MSFEDWVDQFESFTTCYITDVDGENEDAKNSRDNRLIGTLVPGKNAGSDYFEKNLQLKVEN